MREFVPATMPMLAALHRHGELAAPQVVVVDDAFRARHAGETDDDEELHYLAMHEAAGLSLDLLAADVAAPARRVVVVTNGDDEAANGVGLDHVVSFHVDDLAAASAVERAVADRRRGVDPEADELDSHELMWFARQEIAELVSE